MGDSVVAATNAWGLDGLARRSDRISASRFVRDGDVYFVISKSIDVVMGPLQSKALIEVTGIALQASTSERRRQIHLNHGSQSR